MTSNSRFSTKILHKNYSNPNYFYLVPRYVQTLITRYPSQNKGHAFSKLVAPFGHLSAAATAATAATGTSNGHGCHQDSHSFLGAVATIVDGATAL